MPKYTFEFDEDLQETLTAINRRLFIAPPYNPDDSWREREEHCVVCGASAHNMFGDYTHYSGCKAYQLFHTLYFAQNQ